jgi:holo-[acyl-carrier protein] synthase
MIAGIGVDIVEVARIERMFEQYGERLVRRLLTPLEAADWGNNARPSHFLARRFAAKEATFKAFGTGKRHAMSWQDVAVGHDSLGKPMVVYAGKAKEFVDKAKIARSHISITDERHYAIAYVTLETDG